MKIKKTYRERKEEQENFDIKERRFKRIKRITIASILTSLAFVASTHFCYHKGVKENSKLSKIYNGLTFREKQKLTDYGIKSPYEKNALDLSLDGLGYFVDSAINQIRE